MPHLCLGTAQFGLDYGITNAAGQLEIESVRKILSLAQRNNITFLDTAQAYGNAEAVIGQALDPEASVRIISKLRAQPGTSWDKTDLDGWEHHFQLSLKRMRRSELMH